MISKVRLLSASLGLISGFSLISAQAAMLDLYEQPDSHAKVIAKIDTEKGFVPIFSNKSKDWVKVGDPANGNTGWVKAEDITKATQSAHGYSVSQSFTNNGKYPQWTTQFSTAKPMTAEQNAEFWKKFEAQQKALEQDMQQMMHDFYGNGDQALYWNVYPMMMPVVMVPVSKTSSDENATAVKKDATPKTGK